MSLSDNIMGCKFLLDIQKRKVIEMVEENYIAPIEVEDCKNLVDHVLQRLFDMSLEDLSPLEAVMLNSAISDYYKEV